jgi:hypothetical protein
VTGDFI